MNGLAIVLLLVGAIFSVIGFIMLKFPPKNINYIYGYRTNRSMKNAETWKAGNNYSSKLMIILGLTLLIIGAASWYFFPDLVDRSSVIGVGFIIISAVLLIVLTENHLAREFDKEGNPKNLNNQLRN